MARLDAGADAGSEIEGPVLLDGEGGYVPFNPRVLDKAGRSSGQGAAAGE